jgi:hypothetical protein
VLVEALLRHVGVRAGFDARAAILLTGARGDDHDRQRGMGGVGTDRPGQLQPVELGHLEVGHDQRDAGLTAQRLQRLPPVTGGHHLVPGGLQDAPLQLAHGERVLDHEHLGSRAPAGRGFRLAPGSALEAADQRRGFEQQRDPPVPQDGGPEVALSQAEQRAERLHHDLLLAQQLVTGHDPAATAGGQEQAWRLGLKWRRLRIRSQQRGDVAHRQRPPPYVQCGPALQRQHVRRLHHFFHRGQRDPEHRAAAVEQQHVENRQGEREQQRHLRALAGLAAHLEASAQRLHVRLDRVEPDPPARQVGDLPSGGVARAREQLRQRSLVPGLLDHLL